MIAPAIDYWKMSDPLLRSAWRRLDAEITADPTRCDDEYLERLNFVEDAVLQRIGAPDDASGDEPAWQEKIRAYGQANDACPTCRGTGGGTYNDCPTCDGNGVI